ncbi:MAG: HEAT repeat domain-containing protein [Asgard group archaeon]|nr:HEAT repeat domain-containing protein [Asgard group archaeon]
MNHSLDDESPYKEDLESLMDILENDPDWNNRFGAASKLYRLGQEKAVDPLIKALQNDPHKEIRRFSAVLLGRLGDDRATWALIAALRQGIIDKEATIIHHTKEALLRIRGKDLVSILTSTVDDNEEFFEMRLMALDLIGTIGDTKSVQNLINIINNSEINGRIRARAIEQLVYTGHLAGIQLILELLDVTSNKSFQKVVARAISKTPFKNKAIVYRIGESLLKIMEHEESKEDKKDDELIRLAAEGIKQLATNIGIQFNHFMDELLTIRKKQQEK